MKHKFFLLAMLLIVVTIFSVGFLVFDQQEPWRNDQLLNPADLAATISDSAKVQPVIISVGPSAVIPKSVEIGAAHEGTNLRTLEAHLSKLSKDKHIVLYCGCCPFNKCPNIRPAFSLLNTMGFTNHKLLNLPRNVKADWIDAGFPVAE
ncbi:MAG: rhodanese-like domain-containing protein [Chryseolinea sp.]